MKTQKPQTTTTSNKTINIGLDIGIASVGWAVLDKDLHIKERGVRLFDTLDNPKDSSLKNAERRTKRGMRRQKNRRLTLKRDFIVWLSKHNKIGKNFYNDRTKFSPPQTVAKFNSVLPEAVWDTDVYKLRKKALTHKLRNEEVIRVLYWFLQHRGYKYEISGEDDKELENARKVYKDFDKNDFPVNVQLKYASNNSKTIRGGLNRLFSHNQYKKELDVFFVKNWPDLKDEYYRFFDRQRSYATGPGGPAAPTKYGLWIKGKDGKVIKDGCWVSDSQGKKVWQEYETLWDKTTGRCSVYPEEFRAPKKSFAAEVFNLLQDLNNIYAFDGTNNHKLSEEQKAEILEFALLPKKEKFNNVTLKKVASVFGADENNIHGYREDDKKKPLFTKLENYKKIARILKEKISFTINNQFSFLDTFSKAQKVIDAIIVVLSKKRTEKGRTENLTKLSEEQKLGLSSEQIKALAQINDSFSKTHSLSFQALSQFVPLLVKYPKNLEEIKNDSTICVLPKQSVAVKGKYIPVDWADNHITTPTVKRALRQAVHVLNALIKKYGKKAIANVVVEMARENNHKKAREIIKNVQDANAKANKRITSLIEEAKEKLKKKLLPVKLHQKLWLYEQQRGKDPYTGADLDVSRIITDPGYSEIDHIIPLGQCFDNGMHNKVLTLTINNQEKKKRTPFQFLGKAKFEKMRWKWDEWYLPRKAMSKERYPFVDKRKFQYLCEQRDMSDPKNQEEFIKRNLVDTRYITRELLTCLQQYFAKTPTQVKTINGRMTNYIRQRVNWLVPLKRPQEIEDFVREKNDKLKAEGKRPKSKDRTWNGHHAEDAVIVTYLALRNHRLGKQIEKQLSKPGFQNDKVIYDRTSAAFEESFYPDTTLKQIGQELNTTMAQTRFSYMVNTKQNVKLFNETLYEGKVKNKKITPIEKKTLKDMNKADAAKYFSPAGKYTDKVLMNKHDSKTYNDLVEIYKQYQDQSFPFKAWADDHCGLCNTKISLNDGDDKEKASCSCESGPQSGVILLGKRNIKTIRVQKTPKDVQDVIYAPNNQGKNKVRQSFYSTMGWTSLHLYRNKEGKYTIVPVNAKNALFLSGKVKIKGDFYSQNLKKHSLTPEDKFFEVKKNQTLFNEEKNELWRIVGHDFKHGKLEIKPIFRQNFSTEKQIYKAVNTLKGWWFVNVDYLGNVFKVRKLV